MTRITQHMLEKQVEFLNKITNNSPVPFIRRDGENVSVIGHYHIDGAYGGVALHQFANESGAVHDIFGSGHMSKRELYYRIRAFMEGYRQAQDDQ